VPRFSTARVAGRSMLPTLREGDRLLLDHGARPRAGRIAVVRLPGRGLSVKRIAFRVPEGWWVERDNPAEGVDSWLVGAIPSADVVAVVVCRYWPPRRPAGSRT
jgi:hypothetical protein